MNQMAKTGFPPQVPPGKLLSWMAAAVLAFASQSGSQGSSPPMGVHPGYQLVDIPLSGFNKGITGMDFLPDGRMVVVTYRGTMDKPGYRTTPFRRTNFGQVHLLENVQGPPAGVKRTLIADSLLDAMGVCVVEGEIYIGELDRILWLRDKDGDGKYETKEVVGEYPALDGYFEYAFGPVHKDGYFYLGLGVHTKQTGEPEVQLIEDRGTVIRLPRAGGKHEVVARGIRSPDGIALGPGNEIFITDNQGSWRPGAAFMHIQPGRFYGYRNVGDDTVKAPVTPPSMWLPYGEFNNSPTGLALMKSGRYAGQFIYGDFANTKLFRAFLDPIGDTYQGAVFPVTGGLKSPSHRIVIDEDGVIYIGELVLTGGTTGPQKLVPKPEVEVFEMLAVRARRNGLEVEFSQPVGAMGSDKSLYSLKQWHYTPTATYGGPKQGTADVPVSNLQISEDGARVFLELGAMIPGKVVQITLSDNLKSRSGKSLWFRDAYYTLNTLSNATPLSPVAMERRPVDADLSVRRAGRWLRLAWGRADFDFLTIRNVQGQVLGRFEVSGRTSFSLPDGANPRQVSIFRLEGKALSASSVAMTGL